MSLFHKFESLFPGFDVSLQLGVLDRTKNLSKLGAGRIPQIDKIISC
jgi:hypothetical protein